MRIGVDARELCGRSTGVGRYLGGLLHVWADDDGARAHEFFIYAPTLPGLPASARHFQERLVHGGAGTWWEQVQLPRAIADDNLDVFFSPAYTAPLRAAVPVVVAIHDLSFVAHPEWFKPREGFRRRWLTRQAAKRAAAVVTISQFSRRELGERLSIPDAAIHVIPPGIEPATSFSTDPRDEPRVLYAGSIFNRRHVPELVLAMVELLRTHPDASLDIVGDNRSFPPQDIGGLVAEHGLEHAVRCHDYVPDDRLRDLYGSARAFAYLSEYEGLGLPPLEALSAGVPPVLLDTPVARETCADAAAYVSGLAPAAIADTLARVLFDGSVRREILARAPAVLARYNWTQAARDTLAVLEAAGGGRAR